MPLREWIAYVQQSGTGFSGKVPRSKQRLACAQNCCPPKEGDSGANVAAGALPEEGRRKQKNSSG